MPTILYLDTKKVVRLFGSRPELGRIIGGASPARRVTVGMKWSLPKKDWVPDDNVSVRCTVALKNMGKGKWVALCQERHRSYVEWWLVTHCGYDKRPDYTY